jgi:MFS family permease
VLARDRLGAGAGEFGLLSTAAGVGAIAAVWLLPRVNARLAPDAIVWVAAALWAVGTAAVATTGSMAVALAALACTGAASVTTMNVVFSMYTVLLPSWVRGRASSVAMLTIWLAASAGTVAWGAVASASSVRTALLVAAAAHVALTALASVTLPVGRQPDVDISPVAWNMPELQIPPSADAGPVLVTIEWFIDPADLDEFASAMVPIMRQRRRDGGYSWGIFHDLEQPGRVVESFFVSTWAEHERQHHRSIANDEVEQLAARALLVRPETVVRHHVSPARTRRR